jgi:hypothetical protein
MGRSLAIALLAAGACDCGPREVAWWLDLPDASVVAVEVCILEGECAESGAHDCSDPAARRYGDHFRVEEGVVVTDRATRPPRLPEGDYCFVARARTPDCLVVATGSRTAHLPRDHVEVALAATGTLVADCCGAACDGAGNCLPDAGPPCVDDDLTDCMVPRCNTLGTCEMTAAPGDSPCPDDEMTPCTLPACRGGVCDQRASNAAAGAACVAGTPPCVIAGCNGAGACSATFAAAPDGTPCPDDDNPCAAPLCQGGVCNQLATPAPAGMACTAAAPECWIAGCDGAGGCNPMQQFMTETTPCGDTDMNRCTRAACAAAWGGCVQNYGPLSVASGLPVPGTDGLPMRCCGSPARETNIFTDPNNCGGCGLVCRSGMGCRSADMGRGGTCNCGNDSHCPAGGPWTCGASSGRCQCNNDTACITGESQRCNGAQVCVY